MFLYVVLQPSLICFCSNNLYNLCNYLTQCWVTLDKSNVNQLSTIFEFYKVDKKLRATWLKQFLDDPEQYGLYVFDIKQRTFARDTEEKGKTTVGEEEEEGEEEKRLSEIRKSAKKYIPVFCEDNADKVMTILEYLLRKIPLHTVNTADLSITLKSTQSGVLKQLSLLDYLQCITTADQRPTKDMISLHDFVAAKSSLPRCFLANRYLLSRNT